LAMANMGTERIAPSGIPSFLTGLTIA